MRDTNCPSNDYLFGYSLGKTSFEECEEIEEHLDTCKLCQETIMSFDGGDDPLVRAFKYKEMAAPLEKEGLFERGRQVVLEIGGVHSTAKDKQTDAPSKPKRLREYQLLEELGKGGMGSVYRAIHSKLNKTVAIKLLSPERTNDNEAVARFEQEMKAVGAVEHENIVRATDAGEFDGIHFLAMEYVDGCDLAKIVGRFGQLSVSNAAEIVCQMAKGLHAANAHGLVHRDIKPANAMLTAKGQVKILDLGLALLRKGPVNEEQLTTAGQIMGTVDYMAPEQFVDTHQVDIRADIYSLGCTLYYLLTGNPPFKTAASTPYQTLKAHAETAPPPISEYRTDVPKDLVTTLNRMLSKSPRDRHSTPKEVVNALTKFATDSDLVRLASGIDQTFVWDPMSIDTMPPMDPAHVETSTSQPQNNEPSTHGNHKKIIATSVVSLLAIALGIAIFLNTGEGRIVLKLNQVDATVFVDGVEIKVAPNDDLTVVIPVGVGKHKVAIEKNGFLKNKKNVRIFRGSEAKLDGELEPKLAPSEVRRFLGHTGAVLAIDVSPNGKLLASGSQDGTARIWNISKGKDVKILRGHDQHVRSVQFSPDGKHLLTAGKDLSIRLWDVKTGKQLMRFTGHENVVTSASFAPNGEHFVSSSFDRQIRFWQLNQATPVMTFGIDQPIPELKAIEDLLALEVHASWVRIVEFSPDGKLVLSCGNEALVAIWDSDSKRIKTRMVGHLTVVSCAKFVPKSRNVISAGFDNTIRLWDLDDGKLVHTFPTQPAPVLWLDVSRDGTLLASAGDDSTVRVWDLRVRQQVFEFLGHSKPVNAVAISQRANFVFSGSEDHEIRMWKMDTN